MTDKARGHRTALQVMAATTAMFGAMGGRPMRRGQSTGNPKPPPMEIGPFEIVEPPKTKRAKRRARGRSEQ